MTTLEVGSAARAFAAWRTTASAMLVFFLPLPFASSVMVKSSDGFQELGYVVLVVIAYAVGVLMVLPLFAFTIGRWLDRRTAPRGTRHAVITFGIYGLGFGIVLALLLGLGGLTPLGVVAVAAAPPLSAALGRLLLELEGRTWYIVFWGTFTLAVMAALTVFVPVVLARFVG